MPEFKRACHRRAFALLEAMDAEFLRSTHCYFGGGTRLAMELGEYRTSRDVDFVCSDRNGWRALRGGVTSETLGALFTKTPRLAREGRSRPSSGPTFDPPTSTHGREAGTASRTRCAAKACGGRDDTTAPKPTAVRCSR